MYILKELNTTYHGLPLKFCYTEEEFTRVPEHLKTFYKKV